MVDTGDRTVRRDLNDVELIDLAELFLFRQCRTGHTGELFIKAEEVLEGDRGKRFAFALHADVFLGLDCLVQAFIIAAAIHQTAGELVHDDDLPVAHHIVHVALHHAARLNGLVDVMRQRGVFRVGQILNIKETLRFFHAARR